MTALIIAGVVLYVVLWIVAAGLLAAWNAREDHRSRVEGYDAFCGFVMGAAWPAILVLGGIAFLLGKIILWIANKVMSR